MSEQKPNLYSPVKYRLSEEDRAKFGGPEWVTFDRRELFKLDANELMEIEAAMSATIGQFLVSSAQGSTFGVKGMIWLARRFAGMKEQFSTFAPHIFQCDSEIVSEEGEVPEEENPTSSVSASSEQGSE